MEQGRTPGRAHRRRRRASKDRPRTLYERAVESGLKTPRPRRRKLGRWGEAYLDARLWCSATRPGPSASSLQSIATAQGHPTASVSARGARGSSGPSVEAANFHMFPLDEGTGEGWLTLCRELSLRVILALVVICAVTAIGARGLVTGLRAKTKL